MAWESLREWQALSARAGSPIFNGCGALYLYADADAEVEASVKLHEKLRIPLERLDRAQLERRYPQIGYDGVKLGIFQPTMGALMARRAVQTLVAEFVAAGGTYRQFAVQPPSDAAALANVTDGRLAAVTNGNESLRAEQFVFACGPWLPKLFPDVVGTRIVPSRQDVFFFAPAPGDTRFEAQRFPAWVDVSDESLHYGFPVLEARGFKIALDKHGPRYDPDTGERQITAAALAQVRAYLARRFPALADRPLAESRVCQYENTATGDFLMDRHPTLANVLIIGGGSGHGFKHGPAVGRYAAQLVTGRLPKPEPGFSFASHAPQETTT
jgi:glycine/D-amino acid oxidase-like deaminating enzyme